MMRIPSYIYRSRHGVYFFRIVVPKALRETFNGRTEIRRSLHTRKLREALEVARPLALQAIAAFEQVGLPMTPPEPTVADILAKAQAGDVRELKSTKTITLPDGTTHTYALETDSNDPAEIAAFERQVAIEREDMKEAERRYREKALEVPEAMLAYQEQQRREMAAFKVEQLSLAQAREDQGSTKAAAKARTPAQQEDGEVITPYVFDPDNVLSRRWAEFKALHGVNWTAGRTDPANEQRFDRFRTWWGKDDDIRAITRDVINKFILYLKTECPVENGTRRGHKGLGHRTVDNHTSTVSTFLQWAQDKGYFPDDRRLPTDGQTLVSKSARRKSSIKANPPYTLSQLQRIFDPKRYDFKLAHHWWPPLIALFTGARRQEIAQLVVDDFTVVNGIHAMSITDLGDDERRSVKSQASRRSIPVHPELIRMGLIDYIADVKALNVGTSIFPGISFNKYDEKGNAVGTAWGRYLKACGLDNGRSPTYHSFRASAVELLKANKVDFDMRCQMVGHESGHVSEEYTGYKFTVADIMELGIPKFVFQGLDLSGLQYRPHQFDASNRKEAPKAAQRDEDIAAKLERRSARKFVGFDDGRPVFRDPKDIKPLSVSIRTKRKPRSSENPG
jgi:integrase